MRSSQLRWLTEEEARSLTRSRSGKINTYVGHDYVSKVFGNTNVSILEYPRVISRRLSKNNNSGVQNRDDNKSA